MRSLLKRHWFLITLGFCLYCGFHYDDWITPLANLTGVKSGIVVVVLFLMGLSLKTKAIVHSIHYPTAMLLAIAINVLCIPTMAYFAAWFLTPSMGGGLIVAAAVPCTLASASVWTRRGYGNDAVSMFVTVFTNLFCFLIAPATLLLLLGKSGNVDFASQAVKLVLLVLVPLVIAQLLQRFAWVSKQLTNHKGAVSNLSQFGVLTMVMFGAAETSHRLPGGLETWSEISAAGVSALAIHSLALWGGWWLAARFHLPRADRVAVAISGSQKTLMVGLQIASDCGVSMLPMIIYHVGQLVLDTLFVQHPRINGEQQISPSPQFSPPTNPSAGN